MENQRTLENRNITIYDIAKEAGVSTATVSRVLTNNANVRPEKKKRYCHLLKSIISNPMP